MVAFVGNINLQLEILMFWELKGRGTFSLENVNVVHFWAFLDKIFGKKNWRTLLKMIQNLLQSRERGQVMMKHPQRNG